MIGKEPSEQAVPRVGNQSELAVASQKRFHELRVEIASKFQILSTVLLAAACALLTWSTVWLVFPRSYQNWRSEAVIFGLIFASGPLIAAVTSLHALLKNRSVEHGTGRFFIKLAIVVPLTVFLLLVSMLRAADQAALNSDSLIPSLISVVLLLAMAVVGALRLFLPAATRCWQRERVLHGLIVASVAGPIAGLLLWSVLNVALVEWRASAITGSDPYCLQVPAKSDRYKPVMHWSELTGLRMQTPFEGGGNTSAMWQWSFHALLVVSRDSKIDFYNWSYRAQNFVPVSEYTRRHGPAHAHCEPKPGFLYTLAAF